MNDIVKHLHIKADPYVFYQLDTGYGLFEEQIDSGDMVLGTKVPLSCMFEMYPLMKDNKKIGYYFISQFQTYNGGGYLLTYLKNASGKANSVEIMLKTENIVVFNYPNKGTLIISTKINDDIRNIFEEQ